MSSHSIGAVTQFPRMGRKVAKSLLRGIINTQSKHVRIAARNLWTEIKIDRRVRRAAASFQSLRGRQNLKVHLGCGGDIRTGWVNIDLNLNSTVPEIDVRAQPDTIFINYDLRLDLPLPDNTCEMIYSSHFFEHLEYKDGVQLLKECFRSLRQGGRLRTALPDLRSWFIAYLDNDHQYFDLVDRRSACPEVQPETETLVDWINYGVYQFGEHKRVYDEEKFAKLLHEVGFSSVTVSNFEEELDVSSELRRRYTFYIDAIK